MKSRPATRHSSCRGICHAAAALLLPLVLTQCESTGYKYSKIEYTPQKLATPPGHGMTKSQYPFDDEGRYRKEWVNSDSGGRTQSSYPASQASVQSRQSGGGYQGTADSREVPISQPVAGETEVASQSAQYHHVQSGDTLFSIGQRYGADVSDLKRINGLSNDTIVSGQTLRIP